MHEDKILEKLDKMAGEMRAGFKDIRQTLGDHDEQLAFIREYLGEKVVTREEFEEFRGYVKEKMLTRDEYLQGQDQTMTMLKDLKQEMAFMNGRFQRYDSDMYVVKQRLRIV